MKALAIVLTMLSAMLLAACSPHDNWRQVSDDGAHFMVLLPGKPASATRPIDLDGLRLDMTMTAAEVDGVVYVVGTAQLPDVEPDKQAQQGQQALDAMRRALLANIAGQARPAQLPPDVIGGWSRSLDLAADGAVRGTPQRLVVRLAQRGQRLYQVMIMGPAQEINADRLETFFGSFKPT